MRPKSIILLVLALGCGLVASIGINQALSRPAPEALQVDMTEIVVANLDIQIGDPIKPEMIRLESWPTDKVPPGTIMKLEDLQERRARTKIFQGEPLLNGKLFARGESGAGVIDTVPKGMKLATVKVDAVSGMAGLIQPGDRVDMLVHLTENPSRGIFKTCTISPKDLQNVIVKAIDNVFERDKNGEQQVTAKTISLLVTANQAKLVTLASEVGQIRLIGRNADDNTVDDSTASVSIAELFKGVEESSTGAPKTDLLSQLQTMATSMPDVTPRVETKEPILSIEPTKDLFRMTIMEGAESRLVNFENGTPVDLIGVSNPTVGTSEPPAEVPTTGQN